MSAGMWLVTGILAALLERGKSGHGQRVETLLLQTGAPPSDECEFGKFRWARGMSIFLDGHSLTSSVGGRSQILTAQTGRPVFVLMGGANVSNTLGGADMPNVVPSWNANDGPKAIHEWFNTSCFVAPAIGTFRNEGRNNVIGPGLFNIDIASRNFVFRERVRTQFRAETFNSLNYPNFGQPAGTGWRIIPGDNHFGSRSRQMQVSLKIRF